MPAQPKITMIAGDSRRLQQRKRILVVDVVPLIDVDDAALSEVRAELARVCVQGEKLRIHRAEVNDLLAGLAGDGSFGLPIGYAAVLERRLGQSLERRLGIEGPFHRACTGVQCDHAVEGGADIERVIGKDRGRRPDRGRKLS